VFLIHYFPTYVCIVTCSLYDCTCVYFVQFVSWCLVTVRSDGSYYHGVFGYNVIGCYNWLVSLCVCKVYVGLLFCVWYFATYLYINGLTATYYFKILLQLFETKQILMGYPYNGTVGPRLSK